MERKPGVIQEFKDFLLRGNVVDLAVAVVIGAAFGAVISAVVSGLITPLIAAIFGEQDFSALSFTINGSEFKYGTVINALLTFFFVAAAVFFFVVKPINHLMARRKREQEPEPEAPTEEVKLLTEIRDALTTR
jgi:large conductance mechanosensitive channel